MRSVYPGEKQAAAHNRKELMQKLTFIFDDQNSKWRHATTSTVYRTTRWAQPTNISTFLKELGLVLPMAAQPTLGSGAEETSSINITAPVQLGPSSHPIPKPQATSSKPQAPSCSRCKRQASSPSR